MNHAGYETTRRFTPSAVRERLHAINMLAVVENRSYESRDRVSFSFGAAHRWHAYRLLKRAGRRYWKAAMLRSAKRFLQASGSGEQEHLQCRQSSR